MIQEGYEAYVAQLDGTRFLEHQEQHNGAEKALSAATSCFLESKQGSTFEIHVKQDDNVKRAYEVRVKFFVDGRLVHHVVADLSRGPIVTSWLYTKEQGKDVRGRLTFATIDTTEDKTKVTCQGIGTLGIIRVEIWRGRRGGLTNKDYLPTVEDSVGTVLETAKKLGGTVKSTEKSGSVVPMKMVKFTDFHSEPHNVFIFNYRTRPVLELMGIVEPLPQPEPALPRKRKHEAREIIDLDNDDDDDDNAVDRKPLTSRKRKYDGEIIHLDDDDNDHTVAAAHPSRETARLHQRNRFLEGEVQKLRKRMRKQRVEDEEEIVDLSNIDDEDGSS